MSFRLFCLKKLNISFGFMFKQYQELLAINAFTNFIICDLFRLCAENYYQGTM